jgi:hypothetical protein
LSTLIITGEDYTCKRIKKENELGRKERKTISTQMRFLRAMKLITRGKRKRIEDIRNALKVNKKKAHDIKEDEDKCRNHILRMPRGRMSY